MLQTFKMVTAFDDFSCLRDFPSHCIMPTKSANMDNVWRCSSRSWTTMCLPVFRYAAAVHFIQQPVQTGSA